MAQVWKETGYGRSGDTEGWDIHVVGEKATYAGDDGVMACEVGFAAFAAEDLVGV